MAYNPKKWKWQPINSDGLLRQQEELNQYQKPANIAFFTTKLCKEHSLYWKDPPAEIANIGNGEFLIGLLQKGFTFGKVNWKRKECSESCNPKFCQRRLVLSVSFQRIEIHLSIYKTYPSLQSYYYFICLLKIKILNLHRF